MPPATLGTPPGPGGLSLRGALSGFRGDPVEFLLQTAREYGDVSSFRLGLTRAYLVNRPDLIEEVLVHGVRYFTKSAVLQRAHSLLGDGLFTDEGDFHAGQRKAIDPAVYDERLARCADVVAKAGAKLDDCWRDGDTVDIAQEMMNVTLGIAGQALLGQDIETKAGELGAALTAMLASFDTMISPFGSLTAAARRHRDAERGLDETIHRLVRDRRESGADTGDLLSLLVRSGEDPRLTDRQVRDELLTLLVAATETTATSLTWTLYLLSQSPELAERLRRELQEVAGDRPPGWNDIPYLIYTGRVFSETLRLYPPNWAMARMARSEFRLFNYIVPKKAVCIMSPYVMHRHPRFWPDPEKFDPDRWTPEKTEMRPRFAYFPFGGAPRRRLGERLAWMQGILLLAAIGRKWRLRHLPDHPVEVHPQITLRPRHGMPMKLERVVA